LTLEPPAGRTIPQLLFYALPARKSEPAQTLAGTWNCKARDFFDSDGSEFPFTLELNVDRGIVRGRLAQDEIAEGTSREDHFEFKVGLGDDIYRVAGRLQDGKLIGDWKEINTGKGGTWVGTVDQSGMAWKKSPDILIGA
jgi:hypothetical protein